MGLPAVACSVQNLPGACCLAGPVLCRGPCTLGCLRGWVCSVPGPPHLGLTNPPVSEVLPRPQSLCGKGPRDLQLAGLPFKKWWVSSRRRAQAWRSPFHGVRVGQPGLGVELPADSCLSQVGSGLTGRLPLRSSYLKVCSCRQTPRRRYGPSTLRTMVLFVRTPCNPSSPSGPGRGQIPRLRALEKQWGC